MNNEFGEFGELATARATCFRCHKAARVCVCPSIPCVACRTPVHVVQHPKERHHPVGSLRFCELGLQRMQTHVASRVEVDGETRMRSDFVPPPDAYLVYPSSDAQALDALEAPPGALVFLDGTWSTVRALLRGDPRLAALPRLRLPAVTPQRYRIRREPRADYMSTLEAVVRALSQLEAEHAESLEGLLAAFDAMVDTQLQIAAAASAPRRRTRRVRGGGEGPRAHVPAAYLEAAPRRVLVALETLQRHPSEREDGPRARQVVRITAHRAHDDTYFDRWIRPPGPDPDRAALAHMGTSPEHLRDAPPLEAIAAEWQAFIAGAEALVAWNQVDLEGLPKGALRARAWVLKGVIGQAMQARPGASETACARLGLRPKALLQARNGLRVAELLALDGWLQRSFSPAANTATGSTPAE